MIHIAPGEMQWFGYDEQKEIWLGQDNEGRYWRLNDAGYFLPLD